MILVLKHISLLLIILVKICVGIPHYQNIFVINIINREFHSGEVPTWSGQAIKEGDRISVPIKISDSQQKDFQICLAKHKHQHIFKIHLSTTTELQGDCDMYLSASAPKPDTNNWEWKSNGHGEDAISIYGYASEFQKSQLNSLFISVYGKTSSNSCSLQIEILSLPSEEILQKLGLRGGQVLLPRDVKGMKAIGKSRNKNSNIKK